MCRRSLERTPLLLLLALLLTHCGATQQDNRLVGRGGGPQTGSGDLQSNPNILIVASADELPACDANPLRPLVFVEEVGRFYQCTGGQWQPVGESSGEGASTQVAIDSAPTEICPAGGYIIRQDDESFPVCSLSASQLEQARQLSQDYRLSVFRLTHQCSDGTASRASGFLCEEDQVCTNRHAVACTAPAVTSRLQIEAIAEGSGTLELIIFDETDPEVVLHPEKDLAWITLPEAPANSPVLPLSTSEIPVVLSEVLSLSFPLGFDDLYVDLGRVNVSELDTCNHSQYGCPRDLYDFSTTNDTDHGSSGSPLIDVATGEVIGVTTAGIEGENANYTWAISAVHFDL